MPDDLRFPLEWEDIGELVLFLSKESVALRSFLDYLRTNDGTPLEVKMDHLIHWEQHVGFQMGNPGLDEDAKSMLQTALAAPVEVRKAAFHRALGHLQEKYFEK